MAVSDKDRRIAYGIIRHLQSQVDSKSLPEDAAEGVMGKTNYMYVLLKMKILQILVVCC